MFQTVEDYEQDPEASKAELALIAACRVGTGLSVKGGALPEAGCTDPDIIIRANLIRLLALQANSLHENGVQLEGAVITGSLNLSFAKCRGTLALEKCRFAENIMLNKVELADLSLSGSHFFDLYAAGAKVAGNVSLNKVNALGTVHLGSGPIKLLAGAASH